ncbi:speckle targeted PIP5K1A-regulated poly(A) polymerase-like isoform X1 [Epargyreus clarus]|uniref:speckle targeted PIP5K1A-regulated poly(A) polymerase-like isoform X1 n=1 Tax=Epargyreus clarus TaxID=520877 RepID=UPI003C2BEDB1
MEGTTAQASLLSTMQNVPSQASISTTPFQSSPSPDTTPTGFATPPENGIQASPVTQPVTDQPAIKPVISSASNVSTPSPKHMKQSSSASQSSASNSATQSPTKKPRSKTRSKKQPVPGNSKDSTSTSGEAAGSPEHEPVEKPIDERKVEVSGYPSFCKPQDLHKLFSNYGHPRVEHIGKKFAVVSFTKKEQASAAIEDSTKLCLYGQFVTIKPFAGYEEPKKKEQKKNTVAIVDPASLALEGTFDEQLGELLAAVRLSQEQVSAVAALYEDLERVLQPTWPGCQAIPFGSITTGLGVKSSDADCFMYIPPQYRHAQFSFVNRAKRILQQHPQLFAEVFAIPRANTPIVKLFHVATRTHCDLTFKTPLGALNSKLVAFLLHADPRLVPAAVAVKYWAAAHALTGTGRLTNYALTLLLLFYLQARHRLPAVAGLQAPAAPAARVAVDGWDAGFAHDYALLPPPAAAPAPLRDLLGGFFAFYAAFDFDALVVCPLLGRPVEKALFAEPARLPAELERYRRNVAENRAAPFRHKAPVCVMDPFELSHNVASAVSPRLAAEFVAHVKLAAEAYERERATGCRGFLRAALLQRPPAVRARAGPEYRVHLYPRILNAIVRDDWKAALRAAALAVFERILRLKLAPVGEKEAAGRGRLREWYATRMTKPLWKRKRCSPPTGLGRGFVETHAQITEDLLAAEGDAAPVEFHVILSFCTKIRSAGVSIKLLDGDVDAFHAFGKCFLSSMQNWILGVLHASGSTSAEEDPDGTEPPPAAEGSAVDGEPEGEDPADDAEPPSDHELAAE